MRAGPRRRVWRASWHSLSGRRDRHGAFHVLGMERAVVAVDARRVEYMRQRVAGLQDGEDLAGVGESDGMCELVGVRPGHGGARPHPGVRAPGEIPTAEVVM